MSSAINRTESGRGDIPPRLEISCYNRMCKDLLSVRELLICIRCRKGFHSKCCDPPVIYEIAARYPWECNRCKVCITCNRFSEAEEETLLICDACDRAYHLECTKEKYSEIPTGNWFCDQCSLCSHCTTKLTEEECTYPGNFSPEGVRLCTECIRDRMIRKLVPKISPRSKITLSSFKSLDVHYCCVCSGSLNTTQDLIYRCHWCSQGVHRECCRFVLNSDDGPCRVCRICYSLFNAFNDFN